MNTNVEVTKTADYAVDRMTRVIVIVGLVLGITGLLGSLFMADNSNIPILTILLGLSMLWSGTMRHEVLKYAHIGDVRKLKRAILELKIATIGMSSIVLGMTFFHYLHKYIPAFVWGSLLFIGVILIAITTLLQISKDLE